MTAHDPLDRSSEPRRRSPIEILNTLLRHPGAVFVFPVALGVVTVALSLILGQDHVASSRLKPQSSQGGVSRLAGLAAQFGVDMSAAAGGGESVAFFAQVATSREILEDVVQDTYRFATRPDGDSISGTLIELMGVEEATPLETLQEAVEELRDDITVSTDLESGLITVRTQAPWGELAEQINQRILALLSRFNMEQRSSQASEERKFTEARLREAEADLAAAEDELQTFLQRNRRLDPPQVQFEFNRLQRRVDLQQQVYVSLAQAHEQARIDEVRDTPVLTIIEGPAGSARPVGAGHAVNGILGLLLGMLIGILYAMASDYLADRRRSHPDEFAELEALRTRMARRLKRARADRWTAAPAKSAAASSVTVGAGTEDARER